MGIAIIYKYSQVVEPQEIDKNAETEEYQADGENYRSPFKHKKHAWTSMIDLTVL